MNAQQKEVFDNLDRALIPCHDNPVLVVTEWLNNFVHEIFEYNMKKIGITFDYYKREKFEAQIKALGMVYKITDLGSGVYLLVVLCTNDDFNANVELLADVCNRLQISFKNPN